MSSSLGLASPSTAHDMQNAVKSFFKREHQRTCERKKKIKKHEMEEHIHTGPSSHFEHQLHQCSSCKTLSNERVPVFIQVSVLDQLGKKYSHNNAKNRTLRYSA